MTETGLAQSDRASLSPALTWGLLAIAVVSAGLWSLATGGRSDVGLAELFNPNALSATVFGEVRAPRTLAAACLGINLGLAGLALQAVTRNPLASPTILGINQGAALGLALAFVVPGLGSIGPEPLAVTGAFAAGVLSFAIAGGFHGRMEPLRLILGGVAVGAFAYALVRFTYTLDDNIARSVVRWTVGNITDMQWPEPLRLAASTVPGAAAALALPLSFSLAPWARMQPKGWARAREPRWSLARLWHRFSPG